MEYSDWRSELSESQTCQCEGCDEEICVECGENCHDVSEAKIDDVKYGKGKGWNQPDKKRIDIYHARHSYLKKNPPNVRSDRNKRFSAQNVVFYGHDKVERDRKAKHHASRGVKTRGIKKEISGKDTSIDLKTEGLMNFIQSGIRRHNKSINQKKIDDGRAVPYGNMLVDKGKKKVDPKKNPIAAKNKSIVAASHKLEGKLVEEVQGGVSFETYTKGIQFHEVETFDIIKPEPLKPSLKAAEYSDWRVELDK